MLRLLLLLCLVTSHATAEETPATAPGNWLMAHVDVETTGLVPGFHEMIDIGVIITDLEGEEVDRLFLRIMPDHPERTQPGAAAVNGFSVERWNKLGYVTNKEAVEKLISFHHEVRGERTLLFTGFNAWFDISFIDHLFRGQDQNWRELYHYFILDLPSMAWSNGLRDLAGKPLAEQLGLEPETSDPMEHTGITGAQSNVEVYRAILARRPRL